MITFALTGGIACGKSTVTKTFRQYGIPMVDADIVAREVVVPGSLGLSLIIDAFGSTFLSTDGSLNRLALGNLVFQDKDAMNKLNDIMGPLIKDEMNNQVTFYHNHKNPIVGVDGALIIESGLAHLYKPLIVVACTAEQQIERLMKRGTGHGPLTEEAARARINAQMPVADKVALADYVIDTSGTINNSISQTEKIIGILQSQILK